MFKKCTFLAVLLFGLSAHAREIALTFDDCPRKLGGQMTGMERARMLVEGLKKKKVPQVAFFCNSPAQAGDGVERIQYFADSGHIVANHTAHHPNLNKISPADFIKDIVQADLELKNFPNFRKWFRFPMLREGATPQDVVAVRKFLKSAGYVNGYVTVNIEDWYANEILLKAIANGKKWDLANLCRTYVQIIEEEAEFYDQMSRDGLGRSVRHVALLHETDINALCIAEIVDGLRSDGWTIITPDEAYKDRIAAREPRASTPLHMGRVFALAKEAGYKGPYWSKWNEESAFDAQFERRKVFY